MTSIANAPFGKRQLWIVIVSSMEQIIGAGLSTLAGIIIPMINLLRHPELSSGLQGLAGASGLIGIAIGSPIIGRLSDKYGYLFFFRLCPLIIIAGSLLVYFIDDIGWTILGLFITGFGVGGGYSLDSAYISELMPDRWKSTMVGVAKASSSLGFIGVAALSYVILKGDPMAKEWPVLALLITALGIIAFLMRLSWAESPQWSYRHKGIASAQKDLEEFFGNQITFTPPVTSPVVQNNSYWSLFKGENLNRVIFSGIPWACEGVGVYGVGVFLPILVMSLGLENSHLSGMPKITESVVLTAIINCFILVGFVVGILMLSHFKHYKMLVQGFIWATIGLGIILISHLCHFPVAISLIGFLLFEFFLNIGPHLITFIIPPKVFAPADRAAGNGIAAFLGKVGAIGGVFLMPWLLKLGGITLVLIVCIGFNLLGALISAIYGRKLFNE